MKKKLKKTKKARNRVCSRINGSETGFSGFEGFSEKGFEA